MERLWDMGLRIIGVLWCMQIMLMGWYCGWLFLSWANIMDLDCFSGAWFYGGDIMDGGWDMMYGTLFDGSWVHGNIENIGEGNSNGPSKL